MERLKLDDFTRYTFCRGWSITPQAAVPVLSFTKRIWRKRVQLQPLAVRCWHRRHRAAHCL